MWSPFKIRTHKISFFESLLCKDAHFSLRKYLFASPFFSSKCANSF